MLTPSTNLKQARILAFEFLIWMSAYEALRKNIASIHESLSCERCDVRFIGDTAYAIFGSKR